MTILSFKFSNAKNGWNLETVAFDKLNLLVGLSGAGKTSTIKAINATRRAALSNVDRVAGCSWSLKLQSGEFSYSWKASVKKSSDDSMKKIGTEGGIHSPSNSDSDSDSKSSSIISETITRCDGLEIISRTEDSFHFLGSKLPKLKHNESGITLLREEEYVKPIHRALRRFIFSEAGEQPTDRFFPFDDKMMERFCERYRGSLEALKVATELPLVVKAYLFQELFPEEFEKIKKLYKDIFDSVTDVKISVVKKFDNFFETNFELFPPTDVLSIAVKEVGVQGWISSQRLSSGMHRSLVHLIEIMLAPEGTVILIDEFENSLGVNCLPEISTLMMSKSTKLQFILTSHHPYVINNIPIEYWKIVSRKGSQVRIANSSEISSLQSSSAQDNFIQLINSDEYQDGIE